MINHYFQELLYTDRIFKIYMIFKFSEVVIRSLFSDGGPNCFNLQFTAQTATHFYYYLFLKNILYYFEEHFVLFVKY